MSQSQKRNVSKASRQRQTPRQTGRVVQAPITRLDVPDRLALQRAVTKLELARPTDILALQRLFGNRAVGTQGRRLPGTSIMDVIQRNGDGWLYHICPKQAVASIKATGLLPRSKRGEPTPDPGGAFMKDLEVRREWAPKKRVDLWLRRFQKSEKLQREQIISCANPAIDVPPAAWWGWLYQEDMLRGTKLYDAAMNEKLDMYIMAARAAPFGTTEPSGKAPVGLLKESELQTGHFLRTLAAFTLEGPWAVEAEATANAVYAFDEAQAKNMYQGYGKTLGGTAGCAVLRFRHSGGWTQDPSEEKGFRSETGVEAGEIRVFAGTDFLDVKQRADEKYWQ